MVHTSVLSPGSFSRFFPASYLLLFLFSFCLTGGLSLSVLLPFLQNQTGALSTVLLPSHNPPNSSSLCLRMQSQLMHALLLVCTIRMWSACDPRPEMHSSSLFTFQSQIPCCPLRICYSSSLPFPFLIRRSLSSQDAV